MVVLLRFIAVPLHPGMMLMMVVVTMRPVIVVPVFIDAWVVLVMTEVMAIVLLLAEFTVTT